MRREQLYSKAQLFSMYQELKSRLGHQPSRQEWDTDRKTPSSKPVRRLFGDWRTFVRECGDNPLKNYVTNGEKKCNLCREVKSIDDFYQDKKGRPIYCCKECFVIAQEIRNRGKKIKELDYDKNRQRWNIKKIWDSRYAGIKQRALGENGWRTGATGKGLLDRATYNKWCLQTLDEFLILWGTWVKSGFARRLTPSIDRIDNDKGYISGNLQWLTVGDNIDKWHREEEARRGRIVVEQNGVIIARYRNQREASMELGVSQGKISLVLNGRRKTAGGYRFYYEE